MKGWWNGTLRALPLEGSRFISNEVNSKPDSGLGDGPSSCANTSSLLLSAHL